MSRPKGSVDCGHEECRRNARIATDHRCCGGHECEEEA